MKSLNFSPYSKSSKEWEHAARPHRARLVRSYLESETFPQMAWPARSPDLNPICCEGGLQVAVCRQSPSTSSNKPYDRNGHYCRNKRSTTLLPACILDRGHYTRY
ncbi:hypothetical protein AVEN_212310-1 [Araneus ventricosus]|uniref:Uncharacterized protein n=1 Tax=Araneus ventricosus TaxID=182803 RepID=A0A4Y2T055_ARAVE|nr:hypothetical protein AVEN_212310-1 [Araneus ventricosus]